MKYKFKILFSMLQISLDVSWIPKDEFRMGASIFRWRWRHIRIHIWTLYEVKDVKSHEIVFKIDDDVKWPFFSKILFERKYKFEFSRCDGVFAKVWNQKVNLRRAHPALNVLEFFSNATEMKCLYFSIHTMTTFSISILPILVTVWTHRLAKNEI